MDHAEVRERLESALLSPGKLHTLESDMTPEGEQLREHLASCAACSSELRALRETGAFLAAAAPDDLGPRPEVRQALLQAIRETGVARGTPSTRETRGTRDAPVRRLSDWAVRRPAWLALGAVVVAAVLLVAAAITYNAQRETVERETRELAAVTAATDRVLREPDRQTVVLHDRSGRAAGTIVYSRASRELVVVSDALATPAGGERYDCYVERSGSRRNIGWMHFSSGLAYWAGRVESLPDPGGPPANFLVTRGSEDVLQGDL
jgi:hypothetical protein